MLGKVEKLKQVRMPEKRTGGQRGQQWTAAKDVEEVKGTEKQGHGKTRAGKSNHKEKDICQGQGKSKVMQKKRGGCRKKGRDAEQKMGCKKGEGRQTKDVMQEKGRDAIIEAERG